MTNNKLIGDLRRSHYIYMVRLASRGVGSRWVYVGLYWLLRGSGLRTEHSKTVRRSYLQSPSLKGDYEKAGD